MRLPTLPADEPARLALLRSLQILDTPAEEVFDTIATLAARTLGTPFALVTLLDETRLWFKARVGLDARETERSQSFCAHAIHERQLMVVPDFESDARFAGHPLVCGGPGFRSYAGFVLRSAEGLALGTLCVLDVRPREFDDDALASLRALGALVQRELLQREAQLAARRMLRAHERLIAGSEALFEASFEQAPVGIAMLSPDGGWLRFNPRLCEVLGRSPVELGRQRLNELVHPEDRARDANCFRQLMDGDGPAYALEQRYLRPDGTEVWARLSVTGVREDGRPCYGMCVLEDISARRRAEASLDQLRRRLEQRVAERTETLMRTNELLSESLRRHAASEDALRASERELRSVLDQALDAFISIDCAGLVLQWNPQAERTFGWTAQEAVGRRLEELIVPPSHREPHRLGMERLARTGEARITGQRLELPALTKDGRVIPCEVRLSGLDTLRGRIFFAFLHDVSERRQAAAALQRSEQRLRSIADNLPVLISHIDRDERYAFCNATFRDWLGLDPAALVGRPVREALGEVLYETHRGPLRRAFEGEALEFVEEVRLAHGERHLHTRYLPQRDEEGEVQGLYVLVGDVTEMTLAQRRLEELAQSDPLTGLPNRRTLQERLGRALARARRQARAMAVLFLDVDHFKRINDHLGHAVGDLILIEVGRRLRACVRETDTVARYGGDEFVVILEGLADADEAEAVAHKVIAAMAAPVVTTRGPVVTSTSVGIAYVDDAVEDAAALLAKADGALYQAKQAGRNTFCVTLL